MTIQEAKVILRRYHDWDENKDMRGAADAFSDLPDRIDTNEYAEALDVLIADVESINCHECVYAVNAEKSHGFACTLGIKGECKSFTRKENPMNDMVNNPKHYKSNQKVDVECIDITRHLSFNRGNAFKYIWRAGKKGGLDKALEDLSKALWYVKDGSGEPWCADSLQALAIFDLLSKRNDSDVLYKERYKALWSILYSFSGSDVAIKELMDAIRRQAMD